MANTKTIDIGEVAKHTGLAISTLRYYDEKGLIQSTGRHGLRRVFASNVLQRLALISLGRQSGFSLEEIAVMFGADGSPKIDREQLSNKADELDQSIKQLTTMRNGLRHAAACPAPNHMQCPTFLRLLGIAGKSQPGRKQTPLKAAPKKTL